MLTGQLIVGEYERSIRFSGPPDVLEALFKAASKHGLTGGQAALLLAQGINGTKEQNTKQGPEPETTPCR